ncbi:MAG: carboxy terminal-processing peptidase [Spirochaetes bacterium]|nr:carboxy terminal-processing peptidase [Spirochaetota bacterium]
MRHKKFITFVTITLLLFGCIKKTNGLKQEDIEPLTAIFLSRHIIYNEFTDEISERTLINLVNYLDPAKNYFYKSDIDSFMKHKLNIDDYVNNNDYSFIFQVQQTYKKRFNENLIAINELINSNFDFNKDDSIIIDSEKIDYSNTKEELRERWRKNIKLQLLNQLSSDKDVSVAKEKLKKKYQLLQKRVDEINNEKTLALFINAFTTALDPHSNYLTQREHEDFQISTNLKLEGIGVLLREDSGFITVESIMPGGPASKLPKELQLKPDDKIVAVAQANDEPVDVIDMALRDVVNLIRGKKNTVVKLTILRQPSDNNKQQMLIIPILREEIKLEDKAAKSEVYPIKKDKSEIKIGYIQLPSFYMDFDAVNINDPNAKKSSNDMKVQINKLKSQGINGMVIDLRGNPGGALNEAVNIAGMFIDEGPVVQILVGKDNVDVMDDKDPGVYYDGPIVILIDKFSASASEIFAGAIKDYKRGLVIGPSATFGKGSVQTYNVLPGKNGAMKITTALFYQPGGSSNQLNGIEPDIVIPDISAAWDIGENKMRYALKWEKITKAEYTIYNKYLHSNTISSLKNLSSKRIESSKEFAELIKKINNHIAKRKENAISLKEQAKIENQELKEIEKKEKQSRAESKLINMENDLFLKEAFNVTYDYIKMINAK